MIHLLIGASEKSFEGLSSYVRTLTQNLQSRFPVKLHEFKFSYSIWKNLNPWTLLMVLQSAVKFCNQLRGTQDIVHIQYPNPGWGASLFPLFIVLFARIKEIPVVVSIHEYQSTGIMRRCVSFVMMCLAHQVIVANSKEIHGFLAHRCQCIPVNTSFVLTPANQDNHKLGLPECIILFGTIYPNRLWEECVASLQKAHTSQKFSVAVIGSYTEHHQAYAQKVLGQIRQVFGDYARFDFNVPDSEMSLTIRQLPKSIALLLYVDGCSSRRTSLMSMLQFGIPVVTNVGEATTDDFLADPWIHPVSDVGVESVAREVLKQMQNDATPEKLSNLLKTQSWDVITELHVSVYSKATNRPFKL